MSSRPYIVNQTANTQPTGQQLGDEWYNPVANRLFKQVAQNGNTVTAAEMIISQSGNVAITDNVSVSGNITSNGGIRAVSEVVVNGSGSEGGQLVLTYTGITGAIGQANSTWNLDVDAGNSFRIFTQYANSTATVPFTITSANPTFTMAGNVNMTAALGVGTTSYGNVGEIRATNNITAFFSSDQRLKTNIKPIANALSIVEAVGGKTFDWTDEYLQSHGGEDAYFVQKSDFGIIAQDIQQVFPQAVRVRPDGTLAVDYEKLVAVAFQAIVELKAEIQSLRQGQ